MPFKSEAQRKFFRSHLPHLADKWEAHTPKKKLPSRVKKKKKIVRKVVKKKKSVKRKRK